MKSLAIVLAALIWLPCLHRFFQPEADLQAALNPANLARRQLPSVTEALLTRQIAMWQMPDAERQDVLRMRESNAEWDFMGRTFLVSSLANIALIHPERKPEFLPIMDRIIDDTLRLEREKGLRYFLMSYADAHPFVQQPVRSQFLDGEIALMLGMRQLVEPLARYEIPLKDRVNTIVSRMKASPVQCTESYPDECWTFCNAVALAAVKVSDAVNGTNHKAFFATWLKSARERLVDPKTGLLISRFRYTNGELWEGPEGSSIWMIAHSLQVVDEELARDQYDRAKRELAGSLAGFGYSREWPRSSEGSPDVDAGVVIPIMGASAGASGMAMIGAASFHDRDYLSKLITSLNFVGFPVKSDGTLYYAASNQVGDAAVLYSLTLGPAWNRVKERTGKFNLVACPVAAGEVPAWDRVKEGTGK